MMIIAVLLFIIAAMALMSVCMFILTVRAVRESRHCRKIIAELEDQMLQLHRIFMESIRK